MNEKHRKEFNSVLGMLRQIRDRQTAEELREVFREEFEEALEKVYESIRESARVGCEGIQMVQGAPCPGCGETEDQIPSKYVCGNCGQEIGGCG